MTPHNEKFFSDLLDKIKTQPIAKKNYLGLVQLKLLTHFLVKAQELKIDVSQIMLEKSIKKFCKLARFLKNIAGEQQYQAKLQQLAEFLKAQLNDEKSKNSIESLIIQDLLPTEQNKALEDFSKYISWAVNADTRCGNIQDLDRGLYKDNLKHLKYPIEGMRAWLIAAFNTAFPYVWATIDQTSTQVEALQGLIEIIDRLLIDQRLQPSLNRGDKQIQYFCYLILFKTKLKLPILDLNETSLEDNLKILWPANKHHSPMAQIIALQHCLEILQQVTDAESFFKLLTLFMNINEQELTLIKEQIRWPDYNTQLADSRHCFLQMVSPVEAQKENTKQTVTLLNAFLKESQSLLGIEICQVALLVTGSTSRNDRMPKSDVELVLLHESLAGPKELEGAKRRQQQSYIYTLAKLMELAIIALNESPYSWDEETERGGFRLDTSTHFYQDLILSPAILAQQKLYRVVKNDIKELVRSETLLSLLKPMLVNPEAQHLFENFNDEVEKFLAATLTIKKQQDLEEAYLGKVISDENSKKLIFREAAAFYCWLDVLQKSVELLNAQPIILLNINQALPSIDIKNAYYKPLTYLGICLQVFHNWSNELHPHEVFAKASQERVFSQSVTKLLQVSLESILHLRIALHQKASKQDETLQGLHFVPEDFLTLEIISEAIIKPLANKLTERLQSSATFSWKKVMDDVLLAYLTYRRSAFETWQTFYPDDIAPWHPLLDVLADFPGPDGWSPTSETQWNSWLLTVRSLFLTSEQNPALPDSTRCIISGYPILLGDKMPVTTFQLPTEIVAQRFDKSTGEVIGNPDYSSTNSDPQRKDKSSKVFTYVWENQTLFFRFKEGNRECLLGHEIAVEILHRLLGGKLATAPGWPLKLTYIPSSGEPKIHWCWVSLGINGENLGRAMLTDAGKIKDKKITTQVKRKKLDSIEPISYGQLLILALLTFPEDGQPWNFLLEEFKELFRIIAIDNGQSFVNPWEADGKGNLLKLLNIKTMLYLLPNFTQPMAAEVVEWISQLNIDQIIDNWRKHIQQINLIFRPLIEKDLKSARIAEGEWEKLNKLIVVTDEQIEIIRDRLRRILSWLSKHPKGTPQALLSYLEPLVAAEYAKYKDTIKTPEDYYAISPHTYVIKPSLRKDIQQHYQASSRNFRDLLNNTLQVEYIKLDKEAQANYIKHIKSLHFKGMSSSEQCFLLTLMQQLSFNEELSLAHCTELTDTKLEKILKKSPMLTSIDISYCSQITEKSWLNIGWYCKNIEYINLAGNKQLKKLEKNIFGFNDFKQLKKINIADCELIDQNISISLKSLLLKSTIYLQLKSLPYEKLNIADCELVDNNRISLKSLALQSTIYPQSRSLPYDQLIKIVMVNTGIIAGSSCLLHRFIEGEFRYDLDMTFGVEFGSKIIKIDDKIVKLQIWDTGRKIYNSIFRRYCEGVNAFIIIIDITDRCSLNELYEKVKLIHDLAGKNIPILLVANKCDLKDYRVITYEEGVKVAQKIGASHYIECSAKDGTNVEAIFTLAAKAAYNKYPKTLNSHKLNIIKDRSYELLSYKNSLNLVLLGCLGVGKSSWLYKLDEQMKHSGANEVGVGSRTYELKSNHSIDNSLHQAIIWEYEVNEKLNSTEQLNFASKEIIILFIDKAQSLVKNLENVEYIKKYNRSMANVLIVAKENDLVSLRAFSYNDGLKFTESIGSVKYIECSVITGHNLNQIFIEAANLALIKKLSSSGISEDKKIELKKTLEHSDIRLRQLTAETLINLEIYDEQIKQVLKQNLHTDIPDIWYSAKKVLEKLDLLASDNVLKILAKKISSNNEFIAQTAKELFHQYKIEKMACHFLKITRLFYQLLRNPYADQLSYMCCNEIINKIIDYTFDAINQPDNYITVKQFNNIKSYARDKSTLLLKHNKQQFLRTIGCFSTSDITSVSNDKLPTNGSYAPK